MPPFERGDVIGVADVAGVGPAGVRLAARVECGAAGAVVGVGHEAGLLDGVDRAPECRVVRVARGGLDSDRTQERLGGGVPRSRGGSMRSLPPFAAHEAPAVSSSARMIRRFISANIWSTRRWSTVCVRGARRGDIGGDGARQAGFVDERREARGVRGALRVVRPVPVRTPRPLGRGRASSGRAWTSRRAASTFRGLSTDVGPEPNFFFCPADEQSV